MTSASRLGWVLGDRARALSLRGPAPEDGRDLAADPRSILAVWQAGSGRPTDRDCCLTNWYAEGARMELHQDRDEGRFDAPVVSGSLGDPARFRIGGTTRKGPTEPTIVHSCDVAVMGGAARLAYHKVDRVLFGEGALFPGGGRINLTLRVVARDR